jgi:integrase
LGLPDNRRLVTEVGDGEHVGTDATFGQLLDRWLDLNAPDWSPATAREHRSIVERRLKPVLGATPVTRVTTAGLDSLYGQLRRAGGRGGRPLAPASVRRIHVVVHAALAQAVRWKWLRVNPASAASPPRVERSEIEPPSPADVARLLKLLADYDPDLHAYVRLAATSGARRSQLVGLRWSDIDFEAGTATFSRAVVLGTNGVVVRATTKGRRAYRIALDAETLRVLAALRRHCAANAEACGVELPHDAFVFSSVADGSVPWRPDATTHRFRHVARKLGLEGVRLHGLRHYVATRMLSAGADVRTVAGRLGHANPAVTLAVYSHFLAESDRAAAESLAEMLDSQ